MENIQIIEDNIKEVTQLEMAKKIKVRALDYEHILEVAKKMALKRMKDAKEAKSYTIEYEKPELKIVPEPEEKKEDLEESFEEDFDRFAYSGHKRDDLSGIDNVVNERVNGKYKDAPKEEKKAKIEIKEEKEKEKEKEITKEDFEKVLNTSTNFSPKIVDFKKHVNQKYEEANNGIKAKEQEIGTITSKYGEATEIGAKLQEGKREAQNIMTGINSLDLDFLTGKEDEFSRNVLISLETLFNNKREEYNRIKQELKKNTDHKEELGKMEQKAREELKALKDALIRFMKENYELLVKANKIDDTYKETSYEITELTGLEDPIKEEREYVVPNKVASIENLKEKQQEPQVVNDNTVANFNNNVVGGPTVPNYFNNLRQEDTSNGFRRAAM